MHTKRRQNNGNNGMNGNGAGSGTQHRNNNHNNRPRRLNNAPMGGGGGGGDSANVSRTRRHATQQRDKYQMMARDAMSMGDRVQAENCLQHADHYHRVLMSLPPEEIRQQQRPQQSQSNGQDEENGNQESQRQPESSFESTPSGNSPAFLTQPGDSEHQSEGSQGA
jgi:hypothetical protein